MQRSPAEARAELRRLLAGAPTSAPPACFPLDRAALLLGVDEYPALDLEEYERRMEEFAERVADAAPAVPDSEADPRRRLGAMRRVLFEEDGFHGNRQDYYDVRNSYLHEVLDRRLGIPISLAALILGVARRLDWPMTGVNFPSHFLVRYGEGRRALAVDAFYGALILGEEELREMWQRATGEAAPSVAAMLRPACPRAVLVRMLNNIWLVHRHAQHFDLAALAVEKIALIEPEVPGHQRTLGYLRQSAGDEDAAARHFERYLATAPGAADAGQVHACLRRLRGQ